jgi:peptidoglycan/LPS O-acetylase OafA/YrhL
MWLSTASYFTYLIHRPLWRLTDNWLGLDGSPEAVWMHLVPGSLLALTLGFFLQRGYDRLLTALRLK